MRYKLKIQSNIHEVPDRITSDLYLKLEQAVIAAERYKTRIWILNDENRIVADWSGISWLTHGVSI